MASFLTVASSLPLVSLVPSGLNATDPTLRLAQVRTQSNTWKEDKKLDQTTHLSECPLNWHSCSPVSTCHTRTLLFTLVAIAAAGGYELAIWQKATELTDSEWPRHGLPTGAPANAL